MDLSFVIPLCDEEQTLESLFLKIDETLKTKGSFEYEVIFIDDGSHDGSWKRIEALHQQHPQNVKGIRLRRNFGKATALMAGFEQATGEIVFTMDADMQDDPEEIPSFLEKLDAGYDLVSGWKQKRNDPVSKTMPSLLFNFVTRAFSGMTLHDFNCGFKAYRSSVVKSLALYGELHRYIPILADAEGYRVTEIPVNHHAREFGVSKYGWKRLYKGFLDLLSVIVLTRYAQRPAHFFGGIGLIVGASGFGILLYLSIAKLFFGIPIAARPLFFLGILNMLLSAQLVSMGIIGELIIRGKRPGDTGRCISQVVG